MAILTTENASFTYQNKSQTVRAVRDVTCSFDEGRAYAIVGKSGSGKTTLLSLLAGLELPTEGKVWFEGTATAEMDCDIYRRDHAAVIYQSYNLFPLLTAQENVLYPLKLRGMDGKAALELAQKELTAVGIQPDQFKRFPSQLSGGEQQRVAIARALAAGNRIVLADEPTGNLDSENSQNIVEILKQLAHEENRCVIIVTHDPAVAEAADVVIRMKDGKLQETA
mgnify:CR=1 FL=1